ncbi:hypothetical protein [Actinomycetospora aeridis]|uniref:Lipocalin-like domain-containing protein n=1 Tax=Actinomycetospora aeridis TaxID=3129231 RepID=A0ABU8N8E8_9PSEU
MDQPIPRERLVGRWTHSHEEDADDVLVYRPAGTPLPPSRGRDGLALHADGSFSEVAPGADDRPTSSPGRWELDDDRLVVDARADGGSRQVLRVVRAADDELAVRPVEEEP